MSFIRNKKFYYLISFIEGSCVMATELLGAKMLAPYFGASLYVWSTVLAITLGGLASGYFFGGILSYKYSNKNSLFYVLLLAAVFNALMPFTSKAILQAVGNFSLLPAIIFSATAFLFPPVFMMGMVSPLIISHITVDVKESGKAAGSVYAISTVGGIIATFLTGFYIIPAYGLTWPAIVNGIAMGIIPLVILIKQNKFWIVLAIASACLLYKKTSNTNQYGEIKVVFTSEGLLGQLMVADQPNYDQAGIVDNYTRTLYVNHIGQTMLNLKTKEVFPYIKKMCEVVDEFHGKSTALLFGLGGGTLANELVKRGYHTDACELDTRIVEVAKKYFYLDSTVTVYIDDARHFERTAPKKYDLIIFDVFKGEENPGHVFTAESLQETKNLLNPGGIIVVNGNGFFESHAGKGMRSICKTLLDGGFYVNVLPSNNNKNELTRNLLFFASQNKNELPGNKDYLDLASVDMNDAVVLQDEFPVLEILNMEASKAWRQGYISYSINTFNKRNIPLFR